MATCGMCLILLPLTFQFGLSLLYALLSQGEKLLSSGVPLEPSIGDFETWYVHLWSPFVFQHDDTCLAALGQTASSRWQVSCPSVPWWSRSSCLPTCSRSSAATWTNAPCISWRTTWSESPVGCMKVELACLSKYDYWLSLDLRLDSWHFHPKVDRS